ncbi:hypothetical protein Ocin01_15145 [Orchesella cincta]|uniref:Chitin-binding type-2 domain-containing protein n=1 Tax=Orchesella cincta TaxID=48709 RepID=A0A1D2MEU2_ORCCI|nr:hypothetical protein Ocin01_15145 [Orchesella cincta]
MRTEEECPRPLYFNAELERCDFPENVPECQGGTRPPIGENSTTTTLPPTEEPTIDPSTTTTLSPPPDPLTECGQTIEVGIDLATIEYKLNQTYEAGELCVFVVRVPNHLSMIFVLDSHGINNESDPDAITIISFDQTNLQDPIHLGPANTNSSAFVTGNVAFVVFKSSLNSSLGTGFKLTFAAFGPTFENKAGIDVVFNNETSSPLELPTPEYAGESHNYIVLTDGAKRIDEKSGSFLRLNVSEEFWMPQYCLDYFWVYSFLGESVRNEGLICNDQGDKTVFETTGLFIVLFRRSTERDNSTGNLRWEKVSPESKGINLIF